MSRAEGDLGRGPDANYLRRRRYEPAGPQLSLPVRGDRSHRPQGRRAVLRGGQDPEHPACGLPREYVTAAKQERIRKTAALLSDGKGWTAPSASTWQRSIPTGRTPPPPPT